MITIDDVSLEIQVKAQQTGSTDMKKKVLLLGGLGVIGTILTPVLSNEYEVVVSDVKEEPPNLNNL